MSREEILKIVKEATKAAREKQAPNVEKVSHDIFDKYQNSFSEEQLNDMLEIVNGFTLQNQRLTQQTIVEVLDRLNLKP